jgi:NADPH:quinone reductase-like Zn-dependent oxidoreductase
MASIPSHVLAAVSTDSKTLSFESIPTPKPEPHQALVKVSHVAQNPTDGT